MSSAKRGEVLREPLQEQACHEPVAQRVQVPVRLVVVVYLGFGGGWLDSVNYARNHLRLRAGPDASLDEQSRALHPATSFEAWKQTYVGPRAGSRGENWVGHK